MNSQKASEIMRSKGVINVNYDGKPVWLESLNEENVEVTFIGMNQRSIVPISALVVADP